MVRLLKRSWLDKKTIVHVFDPADFMEIYKNDGIYPQRSSHRALAKYRQNRPHLYKSIGLFPSNGEEWWRFRKLFQNILLNPSVAKFYYDALEEVTDDFVATIPKLLDEKKEVDLQPELFKWALECVGAIALNKRLGCFSPDHSSEVAKLVAAANETHYSVFLTESDPLFNYFETPSYKRLVAAQDYFASVVDKYIKEAMSTEGENYIKNSLLHRMLNVPDAHYKDVFTMILDMFLAGIDTTAYTTAFGLYNMARNPMAQQKLRKQLQEQLPDDSSRLTDKIEKCPYLGHFVKETLRLNPVAIGNGRVLGRDLILSKYLVPAGTMVILHHQAASLRHANFKDPLIFKPERWDREIQKQQTHHAFASVPFGAGPRSCVGRRFAQREMMLAFAKIVRKYKVEYHYEDIDSKMRLINVPDKPLRLRLLAIGEDCQ